MRNDVALAPIAGTRRRRRFSGSIPLRFVPVISVAGFLIVWEVLAGWIYPSILIPPFSKVVLAAVRLLQSGELVDDVANSTRRIWMGFVIGSVIGAPIGLGMGSSRLIRGALAPYIQLLRFVPAIAWLTPAVIWFGIGETSKVAIIVYGTVFVVAINTMVGVSIISPNKIWAARMLGATKLQVFRHVVFPACVPFILTGMRLAMGNAFAAVVSAEMVAANEGLGYLIFNSRLWMATDAIFVAILVLGLLGLGTDGLLRWAIRRFAHQYGPVD